jgi:tetratricopeptide (TPR) repeat protein
MAGMAASAGVDCPPEAVPWLHRLSAGDGPLPEGLHDLKGAHVAALSLAWARVDWEALSSYALLDVTALEARVTSSPADEGALLRLTALDPRQADRVLRGATTPLSRAIALTLRGGLRTDEGKLAEGLSDLDEALTLAPWDGLIETLRAMNLRAQRRHDEALAALDRSQRLAPDEGREAMLRGWFLLDAGRHAEAVPVLERARALRPDNADIWGNLGIALHHLGRHAEALPALERAVALNPKLGPAIRFRALTQAALKHDDAPSAEAPPAPTSGAPARMVGFVLLALALLLAVRLLTR